MAWYKDVAVADELDYNKPIKAVCRDTANEYLLMKIVEGHYKVVGFEWFNVSKGEWNSCHRWKTPNEAVEDYKKSRHTVSNTAITLS